MTRNPSSCKYFVTIPRYVGPNDLLVFFNGSSQSKGTGQDNIAGVKLRVQLDRLSRDFEPNAKIIIHIALHHRDVVRWIDSWLCGSEFIKCTRWETEFGEETRMVFTLRAFWEV